MMESMLVPRPQGGRPDRGGPALGAAVRRNNARHPSRCGTVEDMLERLEVWQQEHPGEKPPAPEPEE